MLTILAITIGAAVLLGIILRGRIAALTQLRLVWIPVLYVALVLGLAPLFVKASRTTSRTMVTVAYAILAIFLVRNVFQQRAWLRVMLCVILLGWSLNASTIVANGGMPLSLWAYNKSGQTDVPREGQGGFFKITIAGPSSRLRMLGDVIPVSPIGQVVSIGDLILAIGIAGIVIASMRQGRESDRTLQRES